MHHRDHTGRMRVLERHEIVVTTLQPFESLTSLDQRRSYALVANVLLPTPKSDCGGDPHVASRLLEQMSRGRTKPHCLRFLPIFACARWRVEIQTSTDGQAKGRRHSTQTRQAVMNTMTISDDLLPTTQQNKTRGLTSYASYFFFQIAL